MKIPYHIIIATFLGAAPFIAKAADYKDSIIASNPIVYYRLQETSGSVAENSISSGNYDALYENVVLDSASPDFTGVTGPSVYVTGEASPQSSITTPEIASLHQGSFSVEFLFKDEGNRGATPLSYFFSKGPTHGSTFISLGVLGNILGPAEEGKLFVSFRKEWNGSGEVDYTTNTVLPINSWNQLVLTYDHNASTLALYLNGTSILSVNDFEMGAEVVDQFTFGRRFNNLPATGNIAEISIYDYALTGAIVNNHYQALTAIPEPGTTAMIGFGVLAGAAAWMRSGGLNKAVQTR